MKAFAYIVAGVVLLAALFLFMRPGPQEAPPVPAPEALQTPPAGALPPQTPAEAAPAPAPESRVVLDYSIVKGKVTGPETVRLKQGDQLLIRITSDADDELHLHGYDAHAQVKANQTVELSLTAEHSGRFELELHKSHLAVAVLEVQPK